jgi:hypothetical protein
MIVTKRRFRKEMFNSLIHKADHEELTTGETLVRLTDVWQSWVRIMGPAPHACFYLSFYETPSHILILSQNSSAASTQKKKCKTLTKSLKLFSIPNFSRVPYSERKGYC